MLICCNEFPEESTFLYDWCKLFPQDGPEIYIYIKTPPREIMRIRKNENCTLIKHIKLDITQNAKVGQTL